MDITSPSTGKVTTSLVLGTVKYIHVREDMLTERGNVDPLKLRPIARLGDISYVRIGDPFRCDDKILRTIPSDPFFCATRLPRPSWKTDGEQMQQWLASNVH